MGRGLSDLQKAILTLAYKQRGEPERDGGPPRPADVLAQDVLIEWYGWESGNTHPSYRYSGQHFSKQKIGASKYNSCMAAVSKAFLRLEQRGLGTALHGRYSAWSGIKLTDAGLDAARDLLAK